MNGIIVINKAKGVTSHQVVQSVRRMFTGVKAGHSGTLDPMATGVLPVCLGKATRIVEYIIELPKTYRAEVVLGLTTDTEDAAGQITGQSVVPNLDREMIEKILCDFTGTIEQLPPYYSAVKYQGKALYHWTRQGREVPRQVRSVQIYKINLIDYNQEQKPHLIFEVQCSRGTYVRTLAVDIGKAIGCGAHLSALSREAVGPLLLDNSLSLEESWQLVEAGRTEEVLLPMDIALKHLPGLKLDDKQVMALKNGQLVDFDQYELLEDISGKTPLRIYDSGHQFKALACLIDAGDALRLKTLKFLTD